MLYTNNLDANLHYTIWNHLFLRNFHCKRWIGSPLFPWLERQTDPLPIMMVPLWCPKFRCSALTFNDAGGCILFKDRGYAGNTWGGTQVWGWWRTWAGIAQTWYSWDHELPPCIKPCRNSIAETAGLAAYSFPYSFMRKSYFLVPCSIFLHILKDTGTSILPTSCSGTYGWCMESMDRVFPHSARWTGKAKHRQSKGYYGSVRESEGTCYWTHTFTVCPTPSWPDVRAAIFSEHPSDISCWTQTQPSDGCQLTSDT